jgi:rare lipoprotein A
MLRVIPAVSVFLAACATPPARPSPSAPPPRPRLDTTLALSPSAGRILADSASAALAAPRVLESATGEATWYSDRLVGRPTASGVPYRAEDLIAAHRTYPFGTVLRVTNLRNLLSVVVRVVDRGPWGESARQRATIIDLSRAAAERLDYIRDGRVPVRVDVLEWGPAR